MLKPSSADFLTFSKMSILLFDRSCLTKLLSTKSMPATWVREVIGGLFLWSDNIWSQTTLVLSLYSHLLLLLSIVSSSSVWVFLRWGLILSVMLLGRRPRSVLGWAALRLNSIFIFAAVSVSCLLYCGTQCTTVGGLMCSTTIGDHLGRRNLASNGYFSWTFIVL